ncbi:MAG TPA: ATP-binding cassette domain-containing protein [Acholeplasmataceae bacterium]|nr:ATP-binding cassette domain-containing protein [Acholeplasmataceae bacterium]
MQNLINRFKKETPQDVKVYPDTVPTVDPLNDREILLEVVDADIQFKVGRRIVKACNNLNFKIYRGETFGLVGESGSGKTTISRAIIGINRLHRGAIYFHGENIAKKLNKEKRMEAKKAIQMIFQDPASSLNERANVDYIISEGLYNFKMFKNSEERLKKVYKMLEEVSLLPEHLSRYPHEFSGGQRQRIGIARALVIEPELVLADEPISALDVSIRAQVLNLLKKLQRERSLTYLFIAHDLSIIRYISDRIAVMHKGYIVELGESQDIYSNPIHPYTKALLTAIPQPDPKSKGERERIVYNQGDIKYEENEFIEIKPGRYVLGNQELIKKWTKK